MFQHQDIIDITTKFNYQGQPTRPASYVNKLIVHHSGTNAYPQSEEELFQQLINDANYQNTKSIPGSHGLMYHIVIWNGNIYRTAPDTMLLWHAGGDDANTHGLAVMIPDNFDINHISDKDRIALCNLVWMLSFNAKNDFTDLMNINTYDGKSLFAHSEVIDKTRYPGGTACCGSSLIPIVQAMRDTKMESEVNYFHLNSAPTPQPSTSPVQVDPKDQEIAGLQQELGIEKTNEATLSNQLQQETQLEQSDAAKLADAMKQLTDALNTNKSISQDLSDAKDQVNTLTNDVALLKKQMAEIQQMHVSDSTSTAHNLDILKEIESFFKLLELKIGGEHNATKTNTTATASN